MNYSIFKKNLKSFQKSLNTKKKNEDSDYAKIISLSFLLYKMDTVLTDPKNFTPIKDMMHILNETKNIFTSLMELNKYQKQTSQKILRLNFEKNHNKLWQKLWPEYKIKNDFLNLVDFRGKRLDFNNISDEFKNKSILDVGCGHGSVSFACMFRGAKNADCIDFGEKNLELGRYWAKNYNLQNKMKFYKQDILKLKIKKQYDFVISSAVLHHLKNKNQINEAIKKISQACKKNGYFYFYVRGSGGMKYDLYETIQQLMNDVDMLYIVKVLNDLNFTQEKILYVVDAFKAVYLQTTIKDLINTTSKSGFKLIRRLKGPHKTDMDINQLSEHKFSKIKFGTGELRYLFQKIC
tara:strand:+ start:171 stop:1220 length:1050 start_codon:yes stop_codon:yes gene_type:complete